MKKLKPFEKEIENTLLKEVDNIDVSPVMFSKVKAEIIKREERGIDMKKLISKKRMGKKVGLILGLCMATAIVAAPMMQKYSYVGTSSSRGYTEFKDVEKLVDEIGFTPKYVEVLPNEFYFSEGALVENYIADESSKIVDGSKTKGMFIEYTREGAEQGQIMGLDIGLITEVDEMVRKQVEEKFDSVEMYQGTELKYKSILYKFVPENYKLTDEDIRAQEAEELMISYGSEEIEMSLSRLVSWEENGLSYILLNMNYDLTEDQMLDMAKAVIDSEK